MKSIPKYVIILFTAALTLAGGCTTILTESNIDKLDKLADKWIQRIKDKIAEEQAKPGTPDTPPPADATTDDIPFSQLKWRYGGFSGAGAALDAPRISNLSIRGGNRIYYRWDVGLSAWGLSHSDPGAIAAIFFLRDGEWIGGKFDWVSTSRADRELKHVESYSSWPSAGIHLPWTGPVAYVVVSADGKRRSNVISTGGQ
ncbi:MAG: hypothetical protein ACOYH4_06570 [Saccharofermentanales bacterium]|jgi:hypothetical protein